MAFAPCEAKIRAMSIMGIRWPGDMNGKKNTWSGSLDCAVDAIDLREREREREREICCVYGKTYCYISNGDRLRSGRSFRSQAEFQSPTSNRRKLLGSFLG